MAEVKLTQEQISEVNGLIDRTRELLDEIQASYGDRERFLAARDEWQQKTERLATILPAASEPL